MAALFIDHHSGSSISISTYPLPNEFISYMYIPYILYITFFPQEYTPAEEPPSTPQPIEYFPFFNGSYLAVAASLNGGNALAAFVRTIQQWSLDIGFQVPQCESFPLHLFLIVATYSISISQMHVSMSAGI